MNLFDISLTFAGIWSIVWQFGLAILMIAGLIALAVFSNMIPIIGPYLTTIRRDLIWAAIAIAVFLFAQAHGLKLGQDQCAAKAAVVRTHVDDTVKQSPLNDPNYSDPYNSPDN